MAMTIARMKKLVGDALRDKDNMLKDVSVPCSMNDNPDIVKLKAKLEAQVGILEDVLSALHGNDIYLKILAGTNK